MGFTRCDHGVGHYLGDPLHGLAGELSQIPVEGQLVVQDLIGLNLNVCARQEPQSEQKVLISASLEALSFELTLKHCLVCEN